MDTSIYLVGLNHKTAPLDVRERFTLVEYCTPETWPLPCDEILSEALILSTCNRVELLAVGQKGTEEKIVAAWARARHAKIADLEPYIYKYRDTEAIRHLFSVASSLDSMVLGEPQILGQLKEAYRKAIAAGATGPILNRLLHKAFSVAKRIRTQTAIAASAVSISYAAVELAKRIFGSMSEHKVMLVGAGEMAELAATHLLQAGISKIFVANRTYERAVELAKKFSGEAVPLEKMFSCIGVADIIITSTGSIEPIIHAKDIETTIAKRKNAPLFFIDIAVPRDVDPDVNEIDNVYLYDIDDLKEVVEENVGTRQNEARKASAIVEEEILVFENWIKGLELNPTIIELNKRSNNIIRKEIAHTMKHFGGHDENIEKALTIMGNSLLKKLNHAPIMYLKMHKLGLGMYQRIDTIRTIFQLDAESDKK